MARHSSNLAQGLLFVWKEELEREKSGSLVIPLVLKEDIEAFKHRKKNFNLFCFVWKSIFLILKYSVRDLTVSTKAIEAYLKNRRHYFIIQREQIFIYRNDELLSYCTGNEITMKPVRYDSLIYLYTFACPDLTLGECYVLVEDSLTLKNTFTFLGRTFTDNFDSKS